MSVLLWLCALLATSGMLLPPAAAQQAKNAPAAKAAPQPTLADYETQYRDKGWSRDIVALFHAIAIQRDVYDRVQAKFRHSDQRMITAARDTRDLRLAGRQNFEDISNLSRDEIAALKKHAQQGGKSGAKK